MTTFVGTRTSVRSLELRSTTRSVVKEDTMLTFAGMTSSPSAAAVGTMVTVRFSVPRVGIDVPFTFPRTSIFSGNGDGIIVNNRAINVAVQIRPFNLRILCISSPPKLYTLQGNLDDDNIIFLMIMS